MNTKNKIRWSILGAGRIANAFVKDFPLMQNAELVAVASSDQERAGNFAKEYNIPKALSHDELYNDVEIDAVYIATTNNFHFGQALKCLQSGKAVLCEKPITVNDAEFKKLMSVSKTKNVFLMEAMWTYFLPATQKAKQWLDEGRIGKLKVMQIDFAFPLEKKMEGRIYNPDLGGGSLLDLGVYAIALAYYFISQAPDKIVTSGAMTNTGVDERLGMIFQYGDVTAALFTSIITRMSNTVKLYGEEGYIEIPNFWKASTARLFDKEFNLQEAYEDDRTSRGFIFEMQHANDMIMAGNIESPVIPHSRSNEIQETMTEIRKQIGLKYPFENI
ncbi:MAG TPA: Gfo/Idh/MocA family oxidoreductase [Hanamia sp.]|nr:Gfo/Idh/MocA family oxidoreductase [Hanamia sp.]